MIMIPTLKGFTQQLVPVNGIKINAVTGGSGPLTTPDRMGYHDQTDLRRWQDDR
jgi:hypothetical protein